MKAPKWLFELSNSFGNDSKTGAAAALLNRIISEERDRSTLALCWIRAIFAGLNAAIVFPVTQVPGLSENWPVRYGAVLYFVLATAVLLLAKAKPQTFMRLAAFTPAVIDVPLVGLMQWKQATYATEPGMILADATVTLLVFVMLSTLSLSRVVLVLVTPPALFFIWMVATAEHTPMAVKASVVVIASAFGPFGWVLIGKIRRLVRSSRERDLLGKYVLGDRLGAGGMAEVFKATYSPEGGFERAVAVKRILPQFAESPEVITLFRREAELGARLAHPNVVQVLDFGSDGATYFMAMEFIDGVPLSRIIDVLRMSDRRPSLALLLYLTHELAEALAYIHSRTTDDGTPLQLIHRDFNPPNVMVSRIGEVKVADFGIARSVDTPSLTKVGLLRGKLSYAAPEQVRGEALDSRVDLFALGVTLYELATMKRLFHAPNELEAAQQILSDSTPPLHEHEPSLPLTFCEMVDGLLKRDLATRIASAGEVLRLLGQELAVHDALRTGRAELAALVKEAPVTISSYVPPASAETRTREIASTPTQQ